MFDVAGGILIAIVAIGVAVFSLGIISAWLKRRADFEEDRRKTEQARQNDYRWPH